MMNFGRKCSDTAAYSSMVKTPAAGRTKDYGNEMDCSVPWVYFSKRREETGVQVTMEWQ